MVIPTSGGNADIEPCVHRGHKYLAKEDFILYNKNSSPKWCSFLDYKILGRKGYVIINILSLYSIY